MADRSDGPTFEVPPPDPELRRLDPLVGSWRADDHTQPTSVLGPGVRVTSSEPFHWLDGGYFLVHEYESIFGDTPPQRGVTTGATTPTPGGSGSSSSATTDRSPRRAIDTRGRLPTTG
jgi:hypothetical protein